MYILALGGNALTLFARGAAPNDTCEIRRGGRFMVASTTTLPSNLAAQTVYYGLNTTDTTVQAGTSIMGAPLALAGGGGFGEMFIAENLCTVGPSSVLGCKSHPFVVGDELRFDAIAPAPTGISGSYVYVRSVPDADHFTLSATPGGGLLSVAQDGSGILAVTRQRCFPEDTFSRTGVVWVAASGIECHGGGQPYGLIGERTYGFKLANVEITNCYHPDRVGNQGSVLIVDVVSLYTSNLVIQNRGRSDIETVPPGDDHMHGILHWDNSVITHNGTIVEGVPAAFSFLGGWNRITVNGATLNGADGQSNPTQAIMIGMESAAGSSQPVDVIFDGLSIAGYAVPIAINPSSWFAPTDYSWSRFRMTRLHYPGDGDIPLTYEDVRCCKNVTGLALAGGEVVKLASITDLNGYKLPSVTVTTTNEPQGTGIVVSNPVTWANNARCLVAFGGGAAIVENADTPAPGDFLYTQTAGSTKLTTNSAGAGNAKGVALAGKLANKVPFRCLT